MTTQIRKTQHTLPTEVTEAFARIQDTETRNAYSAALRRAGWTLQSISAATGVTRERIRQINAAQPEGVERTLPADLPVPQPPAKAIRPRKVYLEPDPAKLERLKELQPLAQQNRHNTEEFRQAAEDYTKLVWEVHNDDGVTLYRLAKRLGITHGALRFRLARFGYKLPESGVSKVYTRIMPEHRVPAAD